MWRPPERIKHPLPEPDWPSAAEAEQSLLFSPLEHGALRVATRSWVPAMVPWRSTEGGEVTEDVLDWYGRFARGRPGTLVVEATGIRDVPSGPLLRIGDDRFIPGLRRLVERVRSESDGETRLLIQCIDFLAVKRRPPADKYFRRFLSLDDGHRRRLAAHTGDPSWRTAGESAVREALLAGDDALHDVVLTARDREDLRFGYRERVDDLHLAHVRALPSVLPGLFADAAERARAAGFDGVELHYAHAYTMASFLSRTNGRSDGYGGSPQARLRLPLEVYAAVRARVGADFAVGCRFLGDEVVAGGSRLEDAVRYGVAFAEAGMDFLSLSKGGRFEDAKQPRVGDAVYPYTGRSGYECMPTVFSDAQGPFGRNLGLAGAVRRGVRAAGRQTPIVGAGGITTFALAEGALRRGETDLVGAARQSLADPDWFLKMRLGLGDTVRRCKLTNYCEALDTQHKQVTCQLWDRVDLDAPGVRRSHDGRRRLVAPDWVPPGDDRGAGP